MATQQFVANAPGGQITHPATGAGVMVGAVGNGSSQPSEQRAIATNTSMRNITPMITRAVQ